MLKEKRFLLMRAIGVFAVFTLFTAPSFAMIAFTRGFIQVADDDSYYPTLQAFGQELAEPEVTTEEPQPQPPPTDQEPEPEEGETLTPLPSTEEPQPLTASISIDSTNGDTAPATFLFEADAQGGTGSYTYIWNFGDDSPQGSGISIHHTFENPDTYDVTLAVIDSAGQDISVTRQVNVRPATANADEIAPPSTNETTQLTPMNQTNQTTAASPVLSNPVILISDLSDAIAPMAEPILQDLTQEGVITANQGQTISSVIDRFQANPNSNISLSEATEICNVLVNSTEPSTVEGIVDACESTQRPHAFNIPWREIVAAVVGAIAGWLTDKLMDEISESVFDRACPGMADRIPPGPWEGAGQCCPSDAPYWDKTYEECLAQPSGLD